MPFIIAATDFSDVASNAVDYACKLALAQNADVALIHTYSIPLTLGDMTVPLPASDFRIEAEDGMSKLIGELHADYPQIMFRSAIIYGSIVDAINEFVAEGETPMLAVVGNSATPEDPTWIDSTLMEALKELKYPILAIPPTVTYTDARKIGFVYDNEIGGSEHALQQLAALSMSLGAELHVHYNVPVPPDEDGYPEINNSARGILMPANPLYHYTHGEDIDRSIFEFASKFQLDWLVVMTRHHSFFRSLFHKSHTKVIVNNSFIPVLALHEGEY